MKLKKLLLFLAAVSAVGVVSAQDVVVRCDTVRDTIVIREVVREYILTSDTAKIAQIEKGETAKPKKKKQPVKIHFDFRGEWQSAFDARNEAEREMDGAEAYKSGFAGKYLQFYLDGNITEGLSYHYRQRLNRLNGIDALFKSIDKAYMQYDFKSGWNIAAGKFPLAVGSWEYDAAPIDIYFSTEFWNQVYCFQLGIRGGYNFKDGRNSIVAEIANSPFNTVGKGMSNSMYSYSLLWYGNYRVFQSSYSVNVMEVKDGTYMGQIVLGNRFVAGPMTFELDWLQRFHDDDNMFGDFSGTVCVKGDVLGWVNVFGKVAYDQNRTNLFEGMSEDEPYWIRYNDQILSYGIGIEAFPIKKQRFFRLHAFWNQRLNVADEYYKDSYLKQHYLTLGLSVDFTAFEIR